MRTVFEITRDFIDDGDLMGYIVGHFPNHENKAEVVKEFRVLDDDEKVYFEGKIYFESAKDAGTEVEFDPLDTVGYDYGCTDIQYKEKGKWESL